MITKKRNTYDAEFKRQTVELADTSGRSVTVIERELGLYQGAIRHWRVELAKHADGAFPGTGQLHPTDEQIRTLRRELDIVRQERDILKKAIAIFSQTKAIPTSL